MANNYKQLETKHVELLLKRALAEQQDIIKLSELEKRDLTDAEARKFDEIEAEVDKLQVELDIRKMDSEKNKTKRNIPIYASRDDSNFKLYPHGQVGAKWSQIYPESRQSIKDPDLYLKEIIEKRTMVTSEGAAGGFDVPVQLWSSIYDSALSQSVAMQYCRAFPMESMSLSIPAWDSEDRTKGEVAQVSAEWISEGGVFTSRSPRLRELNLRAHKAGIYVDVSHECLADARSLSSALQPLMSRAVSAAIDLKIVRGDGVVGPQGVLGADCSIVVSRNAAGAVDYTDLASMAARMMPGARPMWLINPDCLRQLLLMVDGASQYIWVPNSGQGAAMAVPQQLLGYPLMVSDYCSALGSKGDVVLADFSYYALATRENVRFETSVAPGWTQDLVSFRCLLRGNGQPLLSQPVTPMYGSKQLSPFVVLE